MTAAAVADDNNKIIKLHYINLNARKTNGESKTKTKNEKYPDHFDATRSLNLLEYIWEFEIWQKEYNRIDSIVIKC